jgi:hypothetical protein
MKKVTRSIFLLSALCISIKSYAQVKISDLAGQQRVVTTTVPFLTITPDSRSGAMADAGVAISPDANAMAWNPAKLAFEPDDMGVSITYTPWLRKLVPDISLSYLSGYKRIDKLSGIGMSLRYFSLGDIVFTNDIGQYLKTHRPYEYAIDLGYARKLSTHFSLGIAGRFIYSNLAGSTTLYNGGTTRPGYTFAGDISGYYTKSVKVGGYKSDLAFGGNISNMGGKITYTTTAERDFIPINLKLGSYLNMHINDFNDLGFALDLNKLLVPTRPVYKTDNSGNLIIDPATQKPEISFGMDPDQPVIAGMVQSFYDAPGGWREELHEIDPSIAMEYWYAHQIAARAGFFYEHPTKGNRQYITVGLGLKYNVLQLDVSYLIPTNGSTSLTRSPLENTLRFTLQFNLQKGKNKLDNLDNPAPETAPVPK